MRKRILMIADSASFWTKNYVMNLLVANGWDVVIFPIWAENEEMNQFYREHGRHRISRLAPPAVRFAVSPRLRMWARRLRKRQSPAKAGTV